MNYVTYDDDGNILLQGVTSESGLALKKQKGMKVLVVKELKPKMQFNYKVDDPKNPKELKKKEGVDDE